MQDDGQVAKSPPIITRKRLQNTKTALLGQMIPYLL